MINKLLNEPYIPERVWQDLLDESRSNNLSPELFNQSLYSKSRFLIFAYEKGFNIQKMLTKDLSESSKEEIRNYLEENMPSIETFVINEIFSHYFIMYAYNHNREDAIRMKKRFHNLSLAEKCLFLELEDYLGDRNLEHLFKKHIELKEEAHQHL